MKAKLLSTIFALYNKFAQFKNRNKPKLLVYTDSRGYNVISSLGKTPFTSYIKTLTVSYNVTYFICPEKYTTLIDFIETYKSLREDAFDIVLLHCGIVDFSPRPLSNIGKVLESKEKKLAFNEVKEENAEYHKSPFYTEYYGEKTTTIYSLKYFEERIIPQLKNIHNLIWINSNHFVQGWDGNFIKGRPANIEQLVSEYDALLAKSIRNVIDIKNWADHNIKEYTIDNIHFTEKGFKEIYKLISIKINKILAN